MYLASTWKSEWVTVGIFVCLRMFQKVEEQWLAEKRVTARSINRSETDTQTGEANEWISANWNRDFGPLGSWLSAGDNKPGSGVRKLRPQRELFSAIL